MAMDKTRIVTIWNSKNSRNCNIGKSMYAVHITYTGTDGVKAAEDQMAGVEE